MLQILQRVHPGRGRFGANRYCDAIAMPEGAQLLQRLELLSRRRRKAAVLAQKTGAIRVQADMPVVGTLARQRIWQGIRALAEAITPERDWRPAEVMGVTLMIERHLDHVGTEDFSDIVDGVAGGGHRRRAALV